MLGISLDLDYSISGEGIYILVMVFCFTKHAILQINLTVYYIALHVQAKIYFLNPDLYSIQIVYL